MNMDLMLLNGNAVVAVAGLISPYIIAVIAVCAVFCFAVLLPYSLKLKKRKEMLKSMEIGDVVVTTCGFYGIVIDITEEDIILEFGSNKNCRIPMSKDAIAKVEK